MTKSGTDQEILTWARSVLETEAAALRSACDRLSEPFIGAVRLLEACSGKVVVTGLGKSGHVARKIAATFASTGTPAFFLHPSEALHGDLGMISSNDCLVALAFGGETSETVEVAKYARRIGINVIAITGKIDSNLARLAHVTLNGAVEKEACPLNLAPTASSLLALAMGDALAISLMQMRRFEATDFAHIHPGGSLGRKLMLTKELMRGSAEFNQLKETDTFSEIMEKITRPNFGIVAVVDDQQHLLGAITDGDIRRAFTRYRADALNFNAGQLMSQNPKRIDPQTLAVDAFREMERYKITSLFVVDERQKLVGLVRMHDLIDGKIV